MDEKRYKDIGKRLLAWYDQNKRDLPWRKDTTPYGTWVCEIMAQQTRITALLPYYERFLRDFPTVHALHEATEDRVLKAWEGLGYYSRARSLKKAAAIIVEQYNGELPMEKEALLKLPGIGEYTAGAIMSIAFGLPQPAVDGNVLRVFARIENNNVDVMLPEAKKPAEEFVRAVMPAERAGCFTQSLMELGALVCIPKTPRCDECPLKGLCQSERDGRQGELPVKSPKKEKKTLDKTVIVLQTPSGRIALRRRTESLLNGLWEYLLLDKALTQAEVKAFLTEQGLTVESVTPMGKANHIFTHMIWQMEGWFCLVKEEKAPDGYELFTEEERSKLALPGALKFFQKKDF